MHRKGDFYLAVTLGAQASRIAENPRIGVVLRIAVLGKEKSGPQAGAAVVAADTSRSDSGSSADEMPGGGGGWSPGRVVAVAVGGRAYCCWPVSRSPTGGRAGGRVPTAGIRIR
ncbi:hypothetical protein [Streptomyces platensis]|uniref:hypothetical protein n=1 Tax=Streptomyces platensis TaxID=58346 RepID=UPI00386F0E4C